MINFYLAGIIASSLHVLSGPDHLAAVTPLVIETEKKGWKIGLTWGLGHLSGMLLIGFFFLIFQEYVPIKQISNYSEQLVGIVLIGVGLWSLLKIFSKKNIHNHTHIHTEDKPYIHKHKHEHLTGTHDHKHTKIVEQTLLSSYSIGFLHGLAGVAHFFLLLPILGFSTKLEGIQYILGFAVGTVLAMSLYAFVLDILIAKTKNNKNFFLLRTAGGMAAIIVGLSWIFFNSP